MPLPVLNSIVYLKQLVLNSCVIYALFQSVEKEMNQLKAGMSELSNRRHSNSS